MHASPSHPSLEGTEDAWSLSPHWSTHPGLISASALENDAALEITLGAWRSLPRRIWWVRSWKAEGFLFAGFFVFWLLLLLPYPSLNTQHLSLLESPLVKQRCRASHYRAATAFLWSRSRLKSGGSRTGKTEPSSAGASRSPGSVIHPLELGETPQTSCLVSQLMQRTVTVCEVPLPLRWAKQNLGKQKWFLSNK